MTDRELLEYAAKAAGLEIAKPTPAEQAVIYRGSRNFLKLADGGWFAPLVDDGDALRLAVKLGIHLTNSNTDAWASTLGTNATEPLGADPYAAARRAIVRAAAEIGKAMP